MKDGGDEAHSSDNNETYKRSHKMRTKSEILIQTDTERCNIIVSDDSTSADDRVIFESPMKEAYAVELWTILFLNCANVSFNIKNSSNY